jgi:hypothetical protein
MLTETACKHCICMRMCVLCADAQEGQLVALMKVCGLQFDWV